MRHRAVSILALCLVMASVAGCSGADLPVAPTTVPTGTPKPTSAPQPSATSRPVNTPRPAATRAATRSPISIVRPTSTRLVVPSPTRGVSGVTATPSELVELESTPTLPRRGSPTEEATAVTKDFDFLDQSDYTNTLGDAVVVGLIKYVGDVTIGSVEIAVDLEDADHNVIATQSADTVPSLVKPGGLIPFKAVFTNPPDTYEFYNTTVQGDEVDQTTLDFYTADFQVTQSSLLQGADVSTPRVVGKVKNTSDTDANDTLVIAAILDADDHVLDVSSAYTTLSSISPGAQSAFEIDFENGEGATKYEIVASGDRP
jgi:hypothetical protein